MSFIEPFISKFGFIIEGAITLQKQEQVPISNRKDYGTIGIPSPNSEAKVEARIFNFDQTLPWSLWLSDPTLGAI